MERTVYLDGQLIPIEIQSSKSISEIENKLKEKFWNSYNIAKPKLIITPYFYFFYHYYKLKDNVIEKSFDGKIALNGSNLKIDIDATSLISKKMNNLINQLDQEFTQEETLITKATEKKVLRYKLSEYFLVPKEQVVISRISKYYIPFYEIKITINKKDYIVKVNASDGKIFDLDKIPAREKSNIEITIDTINDLKNPKSWASYSKGLFNETKTGIKKIKPKKIKFDSSFLTEKWTIVLMILIGLLIIYFALFKL
ncbi:MAG: hypothetical protein PHQ98_01590 [Candidatus ainarchaeum sp.]|nr:hypothetical protein [Candidatus ainarchaeum sp.]